VDGKSWKKLMEMERKSYKLVEQVAFMVDKTTHGAKTAQCKDH
jgi:hypothetical protein